MRLPGVFGKRIPKKTAANRSYAPTWIRLRKTIQFFALAAFILLFLAARWPGSKLQPWSGLFLKLDPLAGLATWLHGLGSGIWTGAGMGLGLGLLTVALTVLTGRTWCGWICPMGTLLEWFTPRRAGLARHKSTEVQAKKFDGLRRVKYILLFTLLFAGLFGSLAWMIFDPLTLLERTLTHSFWPALDWLVTRMEFSLYRFWPASGEALAAFDSWIRPSVLPDTAIPRSAPFLLAVIFGGLIALNWITPRFWCRYLCPLGGLLGSISKFAILRRHVQREQDDQPIDDIHKACSACQLCSLRCPTGTIDPERGFASDPAECTMCLDCLDACPRNSSYFAPEIKPAPRLDYDPDRRAVLTSLAAAAISAALFGSSWLRLRKHPKQLRPPGVLENISDDGGDLPGCIRCGACLQSCPTSGLQPAFSEAGLEGLWTPILSPRLGYCDYSCNACGQVCPVGAIPALDLEEKRQQIIGKAYIDHDRCLAWADGTECIVCEEMCPLPEKAITWEEGISVQGKAALQRPIVDREKCIGCGICEYKCPLAGPAAIQVFAQEI